MGRFFTSFDEAWEFFVNRETDLEDFFARFPLDDHFLLGWLLPLDPRLRPAATNVQRSFSHLEWITLPPEHFLHVWLSIVSFATRRPTADEIGSAVEAAERAWAGIAPFDLRYPRINCFHDGVVAETEGDGPRRLVSRLVEAGIGGVQLNTFLPHLTLGTFNAPHEPTPLREVLMPRRQAEVGDQHVATATLCLMPASRTTILEPWEVVGSVAFG
ncbi:MAG TPA: hypothetical protein VII54_12675 [Gaiellaceae bacterium]